LLFEYLMFRVLFVDNLFRFDIASKLNGVCCSSFCYSSLVNLNFLNFIVKNTHKNCNFFLCFNRYYQWFMKKKYNFTLCFNGMLQIQASL